MIQQELIERGNARLAQRLRWAKLPIQACLEDLDTRTDRGLDPAQLGQLTDLGKGKSMRKRRGPPTNNNAPTKAHQR